MQHATTESKQVIQCLFFIFSLMLGRFLSLYPQPKLPFVIRMLMKPCTYTQELQPCTHIQELTYRNTKMEHSFEQDGDSSAIPEVV